MKEKRSKKIEYIHACEQSISLLLVVTGEQS